MLADVFDCQKQQIWPFRKCQGILFPHCEYFTTCFSYENPSTLIYQRRKPEANYSPPNRCLPKLATVCPCLRCSVVPLENNYLLLIVSHQGVRSMGTRGPPYCRVTIKWTNIMYQEKALRILVVCHTSQTECSIGRLVDTPMSQAEIPKM